MRKSVGIVLVFFCLQGPQSLAFELSILDKVKSWVRSVFVKMPPIPKIEKNAKLKVQINQKFNDQKIENTDEKEKFDYLFIKEIIRATRNRPSSHEEINIWMNTLKQGASREGVYRAITLGGFYRQLERGDHPPTDDFTQLVRAFLKKYINIEFKPRFYKNNFFYIKRITSEKFLEVIDAFLIDSPQNLYLWYSLFSVDIAKKYSDIFKIPLRKNKVLKDHLKWAQNVPIQILKSEVLIKLHKVFNSYL